MSTSLKIRSSGFFQLDRIPVKIERIHAKNRVKVTLGKGQFLGYIEMQRHYPISITESTELLVEKRSRRPKIDGDNMDAKMFGQKDRCRTFAAAEVQHNIATLQLHCANHARGKIESASATEIVIQFVARIFLQFGIPAAIRWRKRGYDVIDLR